MVLRKAVEINQIVASMLNSFLSQATLGSKVVGS